MVMTILEARAARDKWQVLEQEFNAAAGPLPPPIASSFLVQSAAGPEFWRMVTLWRSREGLQQYRQSVDTPAGVLMFRAAGAEPKLSIFDIPDKLPRVTGRHQLHF